MKPNMSSTNAWPFEGTPAVALRATIHINAIEIIPSNTPITSESILIAQNAPSPIAFVLKVKWWVIYSLAVNVPSVAIAFNIS